MAQRIVLQLMQMTLALTQALMASRMELALENLALRQQVTALKRERPRPSLTDLDRPFWANGLRIWDYGLRIEKALAPAVRLRQGPGVTGTSLTVRAGASFPPLPSPEPHMVPWLCPWLEGIAGRPPSGGGGQGVGGRRSALLSFETFAQAVLVYGEAGPCKSHRP